MDFFERLSLTHSPDAELVVEEEEEVRNQFIVHGGPASWLSLAEELEEAADILWRIRERQGKRLMAKTKIVQGEKQPRRVVETAEAPSISRPYVVLVGYALENVVKGLLIARHPEYINSGKLKGGIGHHHLTNLVGRLDDLDLTPAEREMCEILEEAIPYWGRYPIPKNQSQLSAEVAVDEDFRTVFRRLFYEIASTLHEEIADGWDSEAGPKLLEHGTGDVDPVPADVDLEARHK